MLFARQISTINLAVYHSDSQKYAAGVDIYDIRLANLKALQGSMKRKDLAAKLEIDYGQVGHWFMRRDVDGWRGIGALTARHIEVKFKRERGWLDQSHNFKLAELPVPYQLPMIPIIGFAIATPDEDGYFDDMGFPPGTGMGYIVWTSRDPNAYALQVKRESMAPRIRPGEYIVIEPSFQATPGDDVLVKMKNGRRMVKRLTAQRKADVALGSINRAHKDLVIDMTEIDAIQRVGAVLPRSTPTLEPETLPPDPGDES